MLCSDEQKYHKTLIIAITNTRKISKNVSNRKKGLDQINLYLSNGNDK